ncbi:ligand-gated ion channel [Pseudofrancisella aestuarii]|uniref:Ligand-gated ion channel n=1 Tax=Pseudofrancisella aestuarii TaxID=2670347 RepID=A0ABV9TAQ2_9GAMM|nr:ligand-gated ion channel [Pseudofrancisella aestuarii]
MNSMFKKLIFFLVLSSNACFIKIYANTLPSSPTNIQTTAFVTDIINVDELNEQLQIDAIFKYEWNDPRLKFDPQKENANYKLYQGEFQLAEVFQGWRPQVSIINEIGSPQIKAIQLKVNYNGHIILKEHRSLTLETPMKLEKFPFDKQKLKIYMIPFGYDIDEVQLSVSPNAKMMVKEYVKNNPNINIAEWSLKDYKLTIDKPIKEYYGPAKEISRLILEISLDRKPSNILWKVLLPLTLLVLGMWAIFWMDKEALSDRLNISFIGILSVIAYQFLVEGEMPRIDYFTFTDSFLLISFIILFSTILESLIVSRLTRNNKKQLAIKIDNIFRYLFPLAYILLLVTSYLIYI